MTFPEWLDSKGIPYVYDEEQDDLTVNEILLCPYYKEILEKYPDFIPISTPSDTSPIPNGSSR